MVHGEGVLGAWRGTKALHLLFKGLQACSVVTCRPAQAEHGLNAHQTKAKPKGTLCGRAERGLLPVLGPLGCGRDGGSAPSLKP